MNNHYCSCEIPDVDGNQIEGYFCLICNKELEPYEPDADAEYEAQWENEQEKLSI